MGAALAAAAIELGHEVVIVSGPVVVAYPPQARVVWVTSTEEMLEAAREQFAACDGLIGVAAPCDYRPVVVAADKISKTGEPLVLHLVETPDIVATLAAHKNGRWLVGFALETDDHRLRALAKAERKLCDLMVINGPEAMHAPDTKVEIIDRGGQLIATHEGPKPEVARRIMATIHERLIAR